MRPQDRKSFLFLQGPCGPFFRQLGKALASKGHAVLRINFNGGDVLQWPGRLTRKFPGLPQDWPEYVHSLQTEHGFTDLCIFGDCRPYHQAAVRILKEYGLRVHVFEEGYFRPRWITLEEDGVNANSRMPRDPQFYFQAASEIEAFPKSIDIGKTPRHFFRHYFHYFLATGYLAHLFPQYKRSAVYPDSLRLYPAFTEAVGDSLRWGFRLLGSKRMHAQADQHIDCLISQKRPYFIAPLQLSIDSQITCHSSFSSMPEFISYVVRNFARHAPENASLVIKNHPLDPIVRANRMVAELEASSCGIMDRVIFLDGGNLPRILKHSSGAVLINSTTGLSALHHGVPCITLGKAVYDIKGLTHQKSLDDFWHEPTAPSHDLYQGFRKVFMHQTQINGSYYTPQGLRLALQGAQKCLEAGPVLRRASLATSFKMLQGRQSAYQQSA